MGVLTPFELWKRPSPSKVNHSTKLAKHQDIKEVLPLYQQNTSTNGSQRNRVALLSYHQEFLLNKLIMRKFDLMNQPVQGFWQENET
jgi:hypothetical protein